MTLSPDDLLKTLKDIESLLGRSKILDILLYDNLVYETLHLTIPHPKLLEAEFVLRPLCEYVPSLPPFPPPQPNSQHTRNNIVSTAQELIALGDDILDVGRCSTRPGTAQVSLEGELARVIPAITPLREAGINTLISIDTNRSAVAKATISAGADLINDVSAGTLDKDMPKTASLAVPICRMHMGVPKVLPAGVIPELEDRVRAAGEAGVPRWNILLNPGLGLAKDLQQNLELLRGFAEVTGGIGLSWGFVDKATGVEGSTGVVAPYVASRADMVKVHDVARMKKVVDIEGEAIWRQ
ncbi:Dihydropteroate synthase-like protein [Tuber borchii]|uniref:2-amino-4-hydroxy-6-hydroxymethyldihydropteridine diphosphokinase n=1 Tax=Tuber borchii TaxID=42251 RepID=A0A2T6ZP52_TUBBO|nr:Dihydropteroate synthase-like protein [Tuber borchii]